MWDGLLQTRFQQAIPTNTITLGKAPLFCYSIPLLGRLSSVVEHFHGKEGVSGSNPEDGSS